MRGVLGLGDYLDFEAHQQFEGFDRVVASVYEISHENVVRVGDFSANLEQLQQIEKLTVDVSAQSHRRIHRLNVRFLDQNFLHFFAAASQYFFRKNFAAF